MFSLIQQENARLKADLEHCQQSKFQLLIQTNEQIEMLREELRAIKYQPTNKSSYNSGGNSGGSGGGGGGGGGGGASGGDDDGYFLF